MTGSTIPTPLQQNRLLFRCRRHQRLGCGEELIPKAAPLAVPRDRSAPGEHALLPGNPLDAVFVDPPL